MKKLYPDSKVEVRGFEAKHYDTLMNVLTLGLYIPFIRDAISSLKIKKNDRILIFGAGTGRNACLMRKYLGDTGLIEAWDIGEDMMSVFKKRCSKYGNIILKKQRIDTETVINEPFDKVFISFVLHGLPHDNRIEVIKNAYRALKKGGTFHILDYNEFDIDKNSPGVFLFKKVECPYAFDFVKRDWKSVLGEHGFKSLREKRYFGKYVRLLTVEKV
jgi:demethylmenaquinone methyltransferase/2-methoxy-6-polyprenyl-1,4-benzoquinol methylase